MTSARQLALVGGETAGAVFSDCQSYRYRLWRGWKPGPHCLFLMLNPSTADADVLDPTIRRCIGFAKRWSYSGVAVANMYAFRSTDPRMLRSIVDPVGPDNDRHIREAAESADLVVAAWGDATAHVKGFNDRVAAVLGMVNKRMVCLGQTAGGHPRHPLYVAGDAVLQTFVGTP